MLLVRRSSPRTWPALALGFSSIDGYSLGAASQSWNEQRKASKAHLNGSRQPWRAPRHCFCFSSIIWALHEVLHHGLKLLCQRIRLYKTTLTSATGCQSYTSCPNRDSGFINAPTSRHNYCPTYSHYLTTLGLGRAPWVDATGVGCRHLIGAAIVHHVLT